MMAEQFFHEQGGGIDFGKGIVKLHPKLKSVRLLKNIAQKKKAIHLYFNNYYHTHNIAINRSIQNLQRVWRKKEKKFLVVTEKLFGDFQFPQGKYIAYASIINCNPRFLDSKTFQFFYKKTLADRIYTVAHELLHFIFFDFVEKKLKNKTKDLSEDQLWDLSEIFNVIIFESSQYQNIIDKRYVLPYPDHKHLLPQFRKVYRDSCNTEEFIERGIAIIIKAKK